MINPHSVHFCLSPILANQEILLMIVATNVLLVKKMPLYGGMILQTCNANFTFLQLKYIKSPFHTVMFAGRYKYYHFCSSQNWLIFEVAPSFDRLKVYSVTDNFWPAFGWQRPKVPNFGGGYMLQHFLRRARKMDRHVWASRLIAALFKSEHGQCTEKFAQV